MAAEYAKAMIEERLPENMFFHNLLHSQYVVNAVIEIGLKCGISEREMAVVQIAAWFHDTGYCYVYSGHEDRSMSIATTFLTQNNADADFIREVLGCINATKMPQLPQSLLQQIICDADMFHLADDHYPDYAARLRSEWEHALNKRYSDQAWHQTNLNLLIRHKYFTNYGETVLQEHKLANINKLLY